MWRSVVSVIDAMNRRAGETVMWLFLPFTLLVAIDVFQRRVLNSPWYYFDINIQLMSAIAVIGPVRDKSNDR